jgi:hypothetical protein
VSSEENGVSDALELVEILMGEKRFRPAEQKMPAGKKNLRDACEEVFFEFFLEVDGDIPAQDEIEHSQRREAILQIAALKTDEPTDWFAKCPSISCSLVKIPIAPELRKTAVDLELAVAACGSKKQGAW